MNAAAAPLAIPVGPPERGEDSARLRQATRKLEGVFFAQVFAAMRATVEPDSLLGAGPAQEVFGAMLGETLADAAAARTTHSLSEALYRQLAARLGDAAPAGPR